MDTLDRIKIIEESGCLSAQEIINIRSNPQLYFEKVAEEYEKEYNDEDLDIKTQLTIDYAELYVRYLLRKNSRSQEEINYLLGFKKRFIEELADRKISHISSLILNNDVVDALFNEQEKVIVKKYKNGARAAVNTIYGKLKNKQPLTKKEEAMFFKYIGRVDFQGREDIKEMREFVVKSNILENKEYSTFEKQFLCRYLAIEKCLEKKLPIIIPYITSKDLHGKKPTWNGLHFGINKGSIVQISQNFLRKNNFIEVKGHGLAHTVLHEFEHWNQYFNTKNNYLNPTTYIYAKSMVLRLGLSKSDFNEYMKNYVYKESERFANIKAYLETASLVRRFLGENNISNLLCRKAFETKASLTRGVQVDQNGNLFYIGDFNIEQMENVLKSKPEYLNKYPILKNFYSKDGSLRNFKDMVSIYTKYSIAKDDDALDSFEEAIEYHILHGGLNKIDINSMEVEDVLSLLIILQNSLESQIKACKNMLDTYPDSEIVQQPNEPDENFAMRKEKLGKQIDLTNYLFRRRAQVIKELMTFAYTNKPMIDHYCEWNANRRFKGDSKARITKFNLVFYGYNGLETIQSRIQDNPNVVKAGLASDIEDIANFGRSFK